MSSPSHYWERKLVRDPLYGFVGLTSSEDRILNTFAIQRLARIKQLAHTYIVYPSAVHTRLEHALGTLYIAGRMCDKLGLKKRDKQIVRAASLIHDVGHGPYSHLFEEPMRFVNGEEFSHENVTKIIAEHDPSMKKALGKLREEVLDVLDGDTFLSDIVSSSLDADKMDYLRRDSYHTGVAYGIFDLERVVRSVCKVHESDRSYVAIEEKGMEAIESYRLARYSMHTQVYEHHARLIADDMFTRAVTGAIQSGSLSRDYFNAANPEKFVPKFMQLDDNSIEHYIMQSSTNQSKTLIGDIRARRLLKRAYVLPLTKEKITNPIQREKLITMNRQQVLEVEKAISDKAATKAGQVIVHLQSITIRLYERFEESLKRKEKPILILRRDGSVSSMDEDSPISASMAPIRRLFVFCPEKHIANVRKVAESVFRFKSVY